MVSFSDTSKFKQDTMRTNVNVTPAIVLNVLKFFSLSILQIKRKFFFIIIMPEFVLNCPSVNRIIYLLFLWIPFLILNFMIIFNSYRQHIYFKNPEAGSIYRDLTKGSYILFVVSLVIVSLLLYSYNITGIIPLNNTTLFMLTVVNSLYFIVLSIYYFLYYDNTKLILSDSYGIIIEDPWFNINVSCLCVGTVILLISLVDYYNC
jgi:hypothetical protein